MTFSFSPSKSRIIFYMNISSFVIKKFYYFIMIFFSGGFCTPSDEFGSGHLLFLIISKDNIKFYIIITKDNLFCGVTLAGLVCAAGYLCFRT